MKNTSVREFIVQSREGKWARCFLRSGVDIPNIVKYSSQVIVEVLPDAYKVLKDVKQEERVLEFPKDKDLPTGKQLSGVYRNPLTAMVLASLGKDYSSDKKNQRCFAYSHVESGFYVGHDSRDFSEVVES